MSLSTFTINGVVVETTQPLEQLLPLLMHTVPAASAPSETATKKLSATESAAPRRTKKSAPKSSTARTTRKAKPTRSTGVEGKSFASRKDQLAAIRSLYREGDFEGARNFTPKGWVQVLGEIDRAEVRASERRCKEAASAQEAKPQEKPKPKSKGKPKTKKAPTEKVALPTGSEGVEVVRSCAPEPDALIEWKLRYSTKVADILAGGDLDEMISAWAELTDLVNAFDDDGSGPAVAKACHLADLAQQLSVAAEQRV